MRDPNSAATVADMIHLREGFDELEALVRILVEMVTAIHEGLKIYETYSRTPQAKFTDELVLKINR